MEAGHVVLGMDPLQVRAVLGDPLQERTPAGDGVVMLWLYPGHRLHQDPFRSHGATLFRLVFVRGRLTLIEPI